MFRFLKRLFAGDEKPTITITERVTAAQRSPPKRPLTQRSLDGNADVLTVRDAADLISYPNHMLYDLWKTGKFTQHYVKMHGNRRRQRAVSIEELEVFERWVKSANGFTSDVEREILPASSPPRVLVQVPAQAPVHEEPLYRQKHNKTCPFCKRACGGSGYPPHLIWCARKEIKSGKMNADTALLILRATPAGHLFEGDTPHSGLISGKYKRYYSAFNEHKKAAR